MKKADEDMLQENVEELTKTRKKAAEILVKRRDHVLGLLRKAKTTNIHKKNSLISAIQPYVLHTAKDFLRDGGDVMGHEFVTLGWSYGKLVTTLVKAEAFLFQVAGGYE